MRKARYAVAKVSELVPNTGLVVRLGDKGGECALFLHEGKPFAVGSLCPHQNASLDGSTVEHGCVVCRRHGYRFSLTTGDCLTLGGYGLPTYETQIEGDMVYVSVWEYD